MKSAIFAIAFVVAFFAAPTFSVVSSARTVSVQEYPNLNALVATAYRYGIYEGTTGGAAEVDGLRLILLGDNIYFAAFRGDAFWDDGNITDVSLAAFAYFIRFEALVEYLETNNVPGLQIGGLNGDTILSHYLLSWLSWTITTSSSTVDFPDGTTGKLYEATFATSDNVFSYTVKYAGRNVTVDNATITENTFKLGWTIQYYLYTGSNGTAGSLIALVGAVAAEAAATSDQRTATPDIPTNGIDVLSGGYHGYVNYETQSDAWDVQLRYSRAAVLFGYLPKYAGFQGLGFGEWAASGVILSYNTPNPSKIVHDPELGADIPDTPTSPPASTTGSASSAFVSLGLLGVAASLALLL